MVKHISVFVVGAALAVGACSSDENKPAAEKKPVAEKKPPAPPPAPPPPSPEMIEHGAYVAAVSGCVVCHTAIGPDATPFAGGLVVTEGELGTWRSPNITPDKKTGIGDWTDEQIIAAVREGRRPDGTTMYPMMPYMNYRVMSDDDATALVAFLRSLPPAENQVEGSEMKLPQIPQPKVNKVPNPAPEKRGEYLVGLMHCVVCHTPMTPMGPDMGKAFAGGMEMPVPPEMAFMGTGTMVSPNITSDPKTGLGKWTEEDIVKAIVEGKKKDGKPIYGPMGFYSMFAWKDLKPEDAKAAAAFIKSLPPIVNKVPKSTFKPAPPPKPGK